VDFLTLREKIFLIEIPWGWSYPYGPSFYLFKKSFKGPTIIYVLFCRFSFSFEGKIYYF
jgi:hypothetical protein